MALTQEQVVQGLIARGMPAHIANGFALNFKDESAFDPSAIGDNGNALGLAQWNGPRKRALTAFAAKRGVGPEDVNVQLDFLVYELQGPEKSAWEKIAAAKTTGQAAAAIVNHFERPAEVHRARREAAYLGRTAPDVATGGDMLSASGGMGSPFMLGGPANDQLAATGDAFDINELVDFGGTAAVDTYAANAPAPVELQGLDLNEFIDFAPTSDNRMTASGVQLPPRGDAPITAPQAAAPRSVPLRTSMSSPAFETAAQAVKGLIPTGEGGVVNVPPSVPLGVGDVNIPIPRPVAATAEFAGNAIMAPLAAAGGAYNYLSGLLGDVAGNTGLMSPQSAQALARDVASIPEAFAGSPQGLMRPHAVSVAPQAPRVRIEPTLPPRAPAVSGPAEIGNLAQRATGSIGTKSAMTRLADVAKVDPEVAAAADRLGFDLPADIFATETAVTQFAGALRGLKGSDAANAFIDTLKQTSAKAQGIMSEMTDAKSLADVSDTVFQSLRGTREALKTQADELYKATDQVIPQGATVDASATKSVIEQIAADLGGTARMTPKEREIFAAITDTENPLTYAGLVRLKQDIGRAKDKGQGYYADINTATLNRLYRPLVEDQIAAAAAAGGPEAAAMLQKANALTAQRKALEDKMVSAFGKDQAGSIAANLRNAITQGGKGDVTALNKMLAIIPEDLQRETFATAIKELSKSEGAELPFSFAKFAKTYQGLRANPPIYAKIAKSLGAENARLLEDLYRVSKAINTADRAIERTGKANQVQALGAIGAEGLVARIMNSATAKTTVRAGTTAAGAGLGGFGMAMAGDVIGAAMTKGRPDRIARASKLLNSDEFKALAIEAATKPSPDPKTIGRFIYSPAFRAFAKSAGITDHRAWVNAAILGTTAEQGADQ